MTLVLRNLTLNNFGPYRGSQQIDLFPSPGSAVVLIHGENTLGKTQLFSALRWCLYGALKPQQSPAEASRDLPGHMNLPAKREGETLMEVIINFESDADSYRLTRRAEFDGGRMEVTADLRIGATVIPASGIDAEIGRLLHPQISEFFLFDAELLERFYERLASDRERALIRGSIETVLGIPALQLAQRDVSELANDALQRQSKLAKNVGEAEKIQKRLKELSAETTSIERDRTELTERMAQAEVQHREVRDKLRFVEGLQADVREQELLEASAADGSREEEGLRTELKALLGSGWRAVAAPRLHEALERVQLSNSRFQQHESAIVTARTRVAVLEDRMRGGSCPTCDQALPPPAPETFSDLERAKDDLAKLLEESGGGVLDLAQERRISALLDVRTIHEYQAKHRRLGEVQVLQYERKQALSAIADRLQGHKSADIRALGQQDKAIDVAIAGINNAREANEKRAQIVATEQQKLARQLEKLPGAKPEVVYEAAFFRYADDLLQKTIDAYRERVRAEVERDAKEMFLQLIHDPAGYGGLRIDPDYSIDLLDTTGEPRTTSEGGKQLLALSLIGALKTAAVRGGPVVLDSPLGRLDLKHRANVLQTWIPALGGQAVLLVQSGELTKADASTLLGSTVAHAYEILRPSGNPEHVVIEKVH